MNEFQKRKAAIAVAIRKLAADGYMAEDDVADSIDGLDECSATDIASMYRLFVTENP